MNNIRKTVILLVLIMATVIMAVGCSKKHKETAESVAKRNATLVIDEQKQVVITYTEAFDKSYYNKEELEQKVTTELAEYNKAISNDNGAVMESLDVNEGNVVLKIRFIDEKTYTSYIDEYVKPEKKTELFVGTYAEAVSAGHTFAGTFTNAEDLSDITENDFEDTDELMVIYTNESQKILVSGEIVYFGDTVSMEQGLAVTSAEKENYIIYKPDTK